MWLSVMPDPFPFSIIEGCGRGSGAAKNSTMEKFAPVEMDWLSYR